MKTSEFTSHSHTPEPGTPLPLNMQSFYGAVAKSPSPATNGYFSSGGSCGSSCAPRAETGNGAFGEGILRDSSGVPLVPAIFFFAGWIINGDFGSQEGCQRCPLGTMKKSFVRVSTPRFFPILSCEPRCAEVLLPSKPLEQGGDLSNIKIGKMDPF